MSPIVMERDAKHLENGARKYGDRNWEKGQPLSRFLDSAMRHLSKFQEGHRDEDHLAAARWNLGCIIHIQTMIARGLMPKELDDLPDYSGMPKEKDTAAVKPTSARYSNPDDPSWDLEWPGDFGAGTWVSNKGHGRKSPAIWTLQQAKLMGWNKEVPAPAPEKPKVRRFRAITSTAPAEFCEWDGEGGRYYRIDGTLSHASFRDTLEQWQVDIGKQYKEIDA